MSLLQAPSCSLCWIVLRPPHGCHLIEPTFAVPISSPISLSTSSRYSRSVAYSIRINSQVIPSQADSVAVQFAHKLSILLEAHKILLCIYGPL